MDMQELEKHLSNCPKYADIRVLYDPLIHSCPLYLVEDSNLTCFNCLRNGVLEKSAEYNCLRCEVSICKDCISKKEGPY